ncbi:hypothetical protein LXL04_038094 [Taraxacum kok-saghyz]
MLQSRTSRRSLAPDGVCAQCSRLWANRSDEVSHSLDLSMSPVSDGIQNAARKTIGYGETADEVLLPTGCVLSALVYGRIEVTTDEVSHSLDLSMSPVSDGGGCVCGSVIVLKSKP